MDKDKKSMWQQEEVVKKLPYMRPAIIYSTEITTRAGSPLFIGDGDASGVDPADLFGD